MILCPGAPICRIKKRIAIEEVRPKVTELKPDVLVRLYICNYLLYIFWTNLRNSSAPPCGPTRKLSKSTPRPERSSLISSCTLFPPVCRLSEVPMRLSSISARKCRHCWTAKVWKGRYLGLNRTMIMSLHEICIYYIWSNRLSFGISAYVQCWMVQP